MKKLTLLIIGLIVAIGFVAAQDISFHTYTAPVLIMNDTNTDTETNDTTILLKIPNWEPLGIAVQFAGTNISGTTDIDVTYSGSLDGVAWFSLATDSIASGNLVYIHEDIDGFTSRFLKVSATGVGTHATGIKAYLYIFKVPGGN